MTLGVRGMVLNGEGQVLLIHHTYMSGWYMPGGGVEAGESCELALERELLEEAGVIMTGRPTLLSVHQNLGFPGDHVLIYRVDSWDQGEPTQKGEIEQVGWFHPHDLPEGITPATRRRIEEALAGQESQLHW